MQCKKMQLIRFRIRIMGIGEPMTGSPDEKLQHDIEAVQLLMKFKDLEKFWKPGPQK